MRRALAAAALVLLSAVAVLAQVAGHEAGPLAAARRLASEARAHADRLDAQAGAAHDPAQRAALVEAATAARVQAAQADLTAANARVALLGEALAKQRGRLAAQQGPVVRLVGALQSMARQPTIVSLAAPGSVDDLVHLRAVLGAVQPAIAARTVRLRAELDRARRLRGDAALAASAIAEGRGRLEALRLQLVQLEAANRLRGDGGQQALVESDRAIALGERAREIAGTMAAGRDAAQTRESLETLDAPLPRPPRAGEVSGAVEATAWSRAAPPYRLPVAGRLVTGLGEISDAGVRSRGLSFVVAPGAPVAAPARGRVIFAAPFRDYGLVVILDHGDGWTTLLSGLGHLSVQVGSRVDQGGTVGQAGTGDEPRVTVELRRRGRAVDATALAG